MELVNRLGKSSRRELHGVHPDMIIVVATSLILLQEEGIDFTVFDGIRNLEEQQALVDAGSSWTLNSMHRIQKTGFGHAVDLVPVINGKLRFDAIDALTKMGKAAKKASAHHRIPITWGALKKYGGDWTKRNDMYHIELSQKTYL